MKITLLSVLSLLMSVSAIFGQKNKVLIYELDNNNGLYYLPNNMEPFTGTAYVEFKNGKTQMQTAIKKGKPHGFSREWAPNGKKISEVKYENGLKTGTETQWYATGDKMLEINYINGVANGVCAEWHKNKKKKSEGYFENGKEKGEHYWWYSSGEKDQLVIYENGLAEGIVKNWHTNGVLSLESNYEKGIQSGPVKEWYANGQLKKQANYQNGKPHGESKYFAKDGKLLTIQQHNAGALIRDENYRSGNIRSKDGIMQVYNEKESFFMIHVRGEKVEPRKAETVTFAVDGDLLQLYTKPLSGFANDETDTKKILKESMQQEVDFIQKMTGATINPVSSFGKNKNGLTYIYWSFRSPSADGAEQKARTVQEEHYISFGCNKKLFSLYSVVTNSDTAQEIKALLEKQADNLEMRKERIELNALAKTLQ